MPILSLPLDANLNEEIAPDKAIQAHHVRDLYLTLIGNTGLDVTIGGSGTGMPIPGSAGKAPALDVIGAIRASGIVLTGIQTGIYAVAPMYINGQILVTGHGIDVHYGIYAGSHISGNSGIFSAGVSAGTWITATNGVTGLEISGFPMIPSGGSIPTPAAGWVTLFVTGHPGNGSTLLGMKLSDSTYLTGGPYS